MTKNLMIGYYNSKYGNLMDKFIDKFNGGLGYSHTELIIDSKTTIGSSFINGGVGKFKYNNIFASKKWTIVEYDLPAEPAIEFAHTLLGKKYDTLGVVLHFPKLDLYDSKNRYWCSELTTASFYKSLYEKYNIPGTVDNDKTLLMPNESFQKLHRHAIDIVKQVNAHNIPFETIDIYDRVGVLNVSNK